MNRFSTKNVKLERKEQEGMIVEESVIDNEDE